MPALDELADLQVRGEAVDARAEECRASFGSYFDGRDTDIARIQEAWEVAADAMPLRHPDSDLDALAQRLCVGADQDVRLAQAADQLEFGEAGLARRLAEIEPFVGNFDQLFKDADLHRVADAGGQLHAPFENFAAVVAEIQQGAVEPAKTLKAATQRAATISALHEARRQVETQEQQWGEVVGSTFKGDRTDWAAVTIAADWVEQLYQLVDETPTPQILDELIGGEPRWPDIAELSKAAQRYSDQVEEVADLFAEPRRSDVGDLGLGGAFTEFEELCQGLIGQIDSLYDWTDFRHFFGRASEAGWGEFVENLITQDLTADDVVPAFLKAFWNRRLEALFDEEPELEDDFRGGAYQRFITEFQDLDRKLVRTGADRLIGQRNAMRKQHVAVANSEVAVLRHEAGKQRRHKPVRRLLAEIPSLLSELKPCLMMSPLAVSHFLTPKHRFERSLGPRPNQERRFRAQPTMPPRRAEAPT